MQYEKYRFYDNGVEVMIPSCLKESTSRFGVQNSFVSDNNRVIVNVARGGAGLTQEQLEMRLEAYCKGFAKDLSAFECHKVNKRQFLGDLLIDLRYFSAMMGYQFYNAFVLGIYENRELIVTMQCTRNEAAENEYMFDAIADSIRILKKTESTNPQTLKGMED
ncbi:MAG: hypothetical protein K2N90_07930 [Lachnospiraceae bacterium]|nr:hypothetical protein [Lachnospiraceae bacterium]